MLGTRPFHTFVARALAVLAVLLAVPAAQASPAAVVTDLRIGQHAGETRLVLGLSSPVTFDVFTLAEPYRVVIDLPEVGWRLPAKPLPRNKGLLRRLRYSLFKPGVSRVVLDTTGPVAVRQAQLIKPDGTYGHRIVVDLAKTSVHAFHRTLQQPPTRVTAVLSPDSKPRSVAASPVRPAPKAKAKSKLGMALVRAFPPPPRKPTPKPRAARRVVVIDPGHGGRDPGTIGSAGVYEKNITLAVARELKRQLERTGRYKAVLTRNRDVALGLRKRIEIARNAEADLFLSLHADSIKNRRIRGLSVYTLSEKASDREAALLAEKENKADVIAGVDLEGEAPEVANILIDLAQRESMNQSAYFASGMVRELKRHVKLLRNTHRFAGFVVLKAPDIPSVLVELGFLSNKADQRALRSGKYRGKIATGITRAIDRYFSRVEEASRL